MLWTDVAAVDSGVNIAFLKDYLLDSDGRFKGECNSGPVAERDVDSDQDLIPDACDVCPAWPSRNAQGVNTYTLSHGQIPSGGDDPDGDGIPTVCDNCPAVWNPAQTDPDQDGVGLACDLCEYGNLGGDPGLTADLTCCSLDADCPGVGNYCAPGPGPGFAPGEGCLAEGFVGRCAASVDTDEDGVGNKCDNCPIDDNEGQDDADQDDVGDACDNCPGLHDFGVQADDANPECVSHAQCQAINPDARNRCVEQHWVNVWANGLPPHVTTRRCTMAADEDDDGLGDTCDNCRTVSNVDQRNCNVFSEMYLGVAYPYNGDACDSAPCADFDVTLVDPPCGSLNPNDPAWDQEWMRMAYSPQILPRDYQLGPHFWFAGDPRATVGSRRCLCNDGGGAMGPWACRARCSLDYQAYDSGGGYWITPETIETSREDPGVCGAPDPADTVLDAEIGDVAMASAVPGHFEGLSLRGTRTQYADWYLGDLLRAPPQILWSHVVDVPGLRSSQDHTLVATSEYRPRSSHYLGGRFGRGKTIPRFDRGVLAMDPFDVVDDDSCPQCRFMVDVPNLYWQPDTRQLVAQGAQQVVDLTSSVDSKFFEVLASGQWSWTTAAEPAAQRRVGTALLAGVSTDGTQVGTVLALQNGRFSEIMGGRVAGGSALEEATSPASQAWVSPPGRTGHALLLSAVEHTVFVAGGVDQAGALLGDLWRFDVPSARWRQVALNGASPGRVLAATYRPSDRSLYLIDDAFPDAPPSVGRRVRLLRVDLRRHSCTVLAEWKRKTGYEQVYLVNSPEGELVLVGTSAAKGRFRGVRFALDASGALGVTGWFHGPGYVVVRPTCTVRGITLPLATDEIVENAFIAADTLHEQPTHSFGDCL